MEAANYGILSLIPLALTLLLAFWKKDAVFALFMGCLSGVLLLAALGMLAVLVVLSVLGLFCHDPSRC